MTPRQARVALGSFLLLAAGVTGNALYLQGGVARSADKPAPPPARTEPQKSPSTPKSSKASKAADRASVDTPAEALKGTQALKVRTVRVATIGEAPPEETDADTVREIQAELNRRGYGPLAADGVMRPEARAAIMAFEQDHRLALTGEASQALLKHILFGTPAAAGSPAAAEAASPHALAVIKQAQRLLAERGYRPGAIDGRLSAQTIAAIRTFETDQGLVPKGRVSAVVLDRLQSGIAGGGRHTDP
jgi:peptidoglycan hydrolase-like protein with peptidoglycan-binding domain